MASLPIAPATGLFEELGAFSWSDAPTVVERRDVAGKSIPYGINEFWTARQRQGHALHEVSYRACFKPQLPAFFIERLTRPGDRVYDPFMGRGTTPLQAALMGREAIGNDVNPLSAMLCRPRLAPPTVEQVGQRLAELSWDAAIAHPELRAFYHADTLREIEALRQHCLSCERVGPLGAIDDWIRMVALNRLTGHSPGFFSVYSLPPNQAVSLAGQRRINHQRGQVPPRRDVPTIILKKTRALLKDGPPPGVRHRFLTGAAEHTPSLPDASIDLVVTSPPFLDIVQYAADNWLRGWFAGIDTASVAIAHHRKVEDWTEWTHRVLRELARVVRPGGHVCYEVGEVRKGAVELDRLVIEAMQGLPFEPLCVVVNAQAFTKTANCWGIANNTRGTNTNRIVVARRL